ncbi:MAG TPA: TetR/AcrR family transcriptional regulator [Kofleriaceae bacterium]|nr:TetR/AcrR family transcriptional regulator [Kofleriaceae bacterium]
MGSADRRQRQKESLRASILDAARELLVEHGFDAVTMRKIAEKIEYSPTAIYQYFTDKESLVQELCANDFLTLAGTFGRLAGVADPIERLRQMGAAYVGFARSNPNQYRFMFMVSHPRWTWDTAERNHDRGNPNRDAYTFLRWTCTEAIDQDRLRVDLTDPDLAAQVIWGAMHGIIALQIAMSEDEWVDWLPLEQVSASTIETLIRGVTRPGPPDGPRTPAAPRPR